jgi:putative transposase
LGWIDRRGALPLVRQCELAGVSRATVYRPRQVVLRDDDDLALCALID